MTYLRGELHIRWVNGILTPCGNLLFNSALFFGSISLNLYYFFNL